MRLRGWDAFFSREVQERLVRTILYPETGHAVHCARPEWVVRDLEAFKKDKVPPGSPFFCPLIRMTS